MFNNRFSFESHALNDITWKNIVQLDRLQLAI